MGQRGRRSAADISSPRAQVEMIPLDFDQFARRFPDVREAERALTRAERHGNARRHVLPDGSIQWYAAGDLT